MSFVRIAGLPGRVYIPDPDPQAVKKHPCPDCHGCQGCSEQRCRTCRGWQSEEGQEPAA